MQGRKPEYYHVCTEGMEKKPFFRDRQDYISGMNSIPICAVRSGVHILAFCLMDNHVHFILEGRRDNCTAFISEYKRRCSQALRLKYLEVQALHDTGVFIGHIDSGEYLLSSIAYVLRNPVAAGLKFLPFHYPWCSAGLYFKTGHDSMLQETAGRTRHSGIGENNNTNIGCSVPERLQGKYPAKPTPEPACGTAGTSRDAGSPREKRIADIPGYIIRQRLRTRNCDLPGHYIINDENMIMPECYVETKLVESIFLSPKKFLYYMSRNTDREIELSMGLAKKMSFDDSQIKTAMLRTCAEEFNTDNPDRLDMDDKCRLMIMMKKRYGASAKQLARLTGIGIDFLTQLLR